MTPHPQDPKGEASSKKTPLHLLPPYALAIAAWAHALGAKKYGAFNWRKNGVNTTTYIAAMLRHLHAWQDGEDNDPESGTSHLGHLIASANILLDAKHCGTLEDDRSKPPKPACTIEINQMGGPCNPQKFKDPHGIFVEPMSGQVESNLSTVADPNEGYRMLIPEEIVQEGDEFYAGPGDWRKSHCVGMVISPDLGYPYRRKVAEPTTVEGWLRTLPPGYPERALRHCSQLKKPCRSLKQAITEMDDWDCSVEGSDFWLEVYQRAESNPEISGYENKIDHYIEAVK